MSLVQGFRGRRAQQSISGATLLANRWLSQAVRFGVVFALRAVLSAADVGLINMVQVFAAAGAPFTGGLVYRLMRNMPPMSEPQRKVAIAGSAPVFLAEGLLVSALAALVLWTWRAETMTAILAAVAGLFFLTFRIAAVFENILVATAQFFRLNLFYLLRMAGVVAGCAAAWYWGGPAAFLFLVAMVEAIAILHAFWPYRDAVGGFGYDGQMHGGRYGAFIVADKMVGMLAQYCDSLFVLFLGGPTMLAGYYLGINLRGALMQMPHVSFWVRWSSAVIRYEEDAADLYNALRSLAVTGGGMILLYVAATGLAVVLIEWLIPSYRAYVPAMFLASATAVPMGLSIAMRGRQFLNRQSWLMPLFGLARLAVFATAIFAGPIFMPHLAIDAAAFTGASAFVAATAECVLYAVVNGGTPMRRARFLAVTMGASTAAALIAAAGIWLGSSCLGSC